MDTDAEEVAMSWRVADPDAVDRARLTGSATRRIRRPRILDLGDQPSTRL
jgi:hypothetical protein